MTRSLHGPVNPTHEPMKHTVLWTLTAALVTTTGALLARRVLGDREAAALGAQLTAGADPTRFSEASLRSLPEPAQRYLRHAIAPGTPLAPACRLWMDGTMTPTPGAPPTDLTATETLAPRTGFVWTARARMKGLPVYVRDFYHRGRGGVAVAVLGVVPIPLGGEAADVTRASQGRLVGEAVWCPTALVHPDVTWEAVADDRAQFTVAVDGDPVTVTLHLADDGVLREVTLDRWGSPDGQAARFHPYGFRVDAEGTFGGVTIPTRLTGGWGYGTDGYDPSVAASFTVRRAEWVLPHP